MAKTWILITIYQFWGDLTIFLYFRWPFFSLISHKYCEDFLLFCLRFYLSFFYLLLPSEISSPTPFLYHKTSRGLVFKIYQSNITHRYIFVKRWHPHFLEILYYHSLSFVLLSFFVWLCCMCVCLAAPFFFVGSELQQYPWKQTQNFECQFKLDFNGAGLFYCPLNWQLKMYYGTPNCLFPHLLKLLVAASGLCKDTKTLVKSMSKYAVD